MPTTTRVRPSGKLTNPAPAPIVLHGLDFLPPPVYVRLHLFFPPNQPKSDAVENFRTSLADALDFYPPIAGSLRPGEAGRPTLYCDSRGVDFIHENVSYAYRDVPGGDSEALGPQMELRNDPPLLAVKVTTFSCGTIALCLSMYHLVSDLQGYLDFLFTWAKIARGEPVMPSSVPHTWARTPLQYFTGIAAPPPASLPGYTVLDAPAPPPPGPPKPAAQIRYFVSDSNMKALKAECKPRLDTDGVPWISSGDALTALLWRASTRCRHGAGVKDGDRDVLGMAVDGRDRSEGKGMMNGQYFGNFIVGAALDLPTEMLLRKGADGLWRVAGAIRKGLTEQTTPEIIKAKVEFIQSVEPFGRLMQQYDTMLSNWSRFPLTGPSLDFGWGAPTGYAIGDTQFPAGVLSILGAKGGVLSVLAMEEEAAELARNDEELLKYGKFVSSWIV
ncbi:transferase-domain-containing protein [Dentipellis sp. KUC8613]|nr:transferase-domain-containing protein [Dentipellis sp. KUC8613]